MRKKAAACRVTIVALLLSTGAAMAQQACGSYTVERGDNLRKIARQAYGDGDKYRLVFDANRAAIGQKADLIEVGMVLAIPCDPAATGGQAVTTASAAAPVAKAGERPLTLVTANDYAPFTDERLPGGGIFTQLVEMSVFRAAPDRAYTLTFINDWQAHIDALLPAHAYDLSFPWTRPDCEHAASLSAGDRNRCENFAFSAPFYEVVDGFFARKDSGLGEATRYSEFNGKRICRPEGYTTGVLDAAGLVAPTVELVRPTQVSVCFDKLMKGEVDLVSLDTQVAVDEAARMGLTDQIVENPQLNHVKTLHVIAHKSNPEAVKALDMLNAGITQMYQSGEWYDIVSTALKNDQPAKTN